MTETATLRRQIKEIRNFRTSDIGRSILDPRSMAPDILGSDYKLSWRNWAFKAKDWLETLQPGLEDTLSTVEGLRNELTEQEISAYQVTGHANTQLKRFLKHRTDGEPLELIRSVTHQHGLEQYRRLAQMCDPTSGGRSWADSKALFNPPRVSHIGEVPARIAEWKTLERRCAARSGESIPSSMRIFALMGMVPQSLCNQLMLVPAVANSTISFDDLETLIISHVHQKWDGPAPMLHTLESEIQQLEQNVEEFTLDGGEEIYTLVTKNGKKVAQKKTMNPIRTQGTFNGKCWRCERVGHKGADCRSKTKANGKPLNPPRQPAKSLEESAQEGAQQPATTQLGVIELCPITQVQPGEAAHNSFECWMNEEVDPWTQGADPWVTTHHGNPVWELSEGSGLGLCRAWNRGRPNSCQEGCCPDSETEAHPSDVPQYSEAQLQELGEFLMLQADEKSLEAIVPAPSTEALTAAGNP